MNLLWVGLAALAVLFAMLHPAGAGLAAGAESGLLVALYALGSVVLHNYVNLNISVRLTVLQAVAYSVEWLVVGAAISLVYRA